MDAMHTGPADLDAGPTGLTVTVSVGDLVMLSLGLDQVVMRQQSVADVALLAAALSRASAFALEQLAAGITAAADSTAEQHH